MCQGQTPQGLVDGPLWVFQATFQSFIKPQIHVSVSHDLIVECESHVLHGAKIFGGRLSPRVYTRVIIVNESEQNNEN